MRLEGDSSHDLYRINLVTGLATRVNTANAPAATPSAIGAVGGAAVKLLAMSIAPPLVALSQATSSVSEAGGPARILVFRSGDTSVAVSVNFATSAGTATAGTDYQEKSLVLTFAVGETFKIIEIGIINDSDNEAHETVNLSLTQPSGGGGAVLGLDAAILSILDED